MELSGAAYLASLFMRADVFILILVRFIGFLVITPIFSGRSIPVMTKLAFSLIFSVMVFTSGSIDFVVFEDNIIGYMLLILKEFVVGLIMGFVVFLAFNIMYLAGFISDQQIGLTMANVFDPVSQIQVPISGNFYYLIMCAFLVASGGHRMLVSTVFYSFKAIPLGTAMVVGNGGLMDMFMEMMTQFFIIGVLVALPVIGVMLVLDVALGVMARAVPKMNIFAVGMSVKIVVGLSVLWIISPMLGTIYNMIYELLTQNLVNAVRAMMPS